MTEHYELLYIVPIKFLDEELQKVIGTVNELIKKFNGTITKESNLGKQKLAYPINQVYQGSYILTDYDMAPENNKLLELQLKLTQEVLRYMVVIKRIKSSEEIAREAQIKEGIRKEKEDELTEIEEKEKEIIVKKDKSTKSVTKKSNNKPVTEVQVDAKKSDEKATLEDLDKKLDELLTDDIL